MLASSSLVTMMCGGITDHADTCNRAKCEKVCIRTSLPDTLRVTWCDGCGRIDVTHPGRHLFLGRMCPGTVRQYVYARREASSD